MTLVRPITEIEPIPLGKGAHGGPSDGFCSMELVAWMAGEPWSDHPDCVSPLIGAFVRQWNDDLSDADRNRLLKPVLPKLIGTATTDADEDRRSWMLLDWMCRVQTPSWLRLAGLEADAVALESLPEISAFDALAATTPILEEAKRKSAAAWAAAGDAAWVAAGAAAWVAAGAAAGARLSPVVVKLQESAVELIDRLCAVGRPAAA